MTTKPTHDVSLLSWNILAPCWVNREWYPTLYDVAADHQTRINTITAHISSLGHDVIMIQEAQEDTIPLLKEKLGDGYLYEFAPNNPTAASIANGLLVLIRKDWKYASEATITNGIVDPERGEAIQIITIASKKIHLVNLHLDYFHSALQAKLVKDKCNEMLGTTHPMAVMAGDLNAETEKCDEFQWIGYEDAFRETTEDARISTYYPDPKQEARSLAIDHIFYDPGQVILVEHGKAWDTSDRSLEDALKQLGSDHIYVWAVFNFIQNKK
jgi:endonuclease/exonuclease/phosphatase family metal-dependent hydrolase